MKVHRFEIRVKGDDPRAASVLRDAEALGLAPTGVDIAQVYLVQAALSPKQVEIVTSRLLVDPVMEEPTLGFRPPAPHTTLIEVHPLPGVMDPAAQSVRDAIRDLLGMADGDVQVSTGRRYDLLGVSEAQAMRLATTALANPVIHAVHAKPFMPNELPRGKAYHHKITHVPLRSLDDDALTRLSRDAHLFLTLDEMRAIRYHYAALGRDPTDIELETLAQTWSEHCVHKTLKSRVRYRAIGEDRIDWRNRPGHMLHPDGTVEIDNLLKRTVAAATHELIESGLDWTLSVFKDNSGVIAFDEYHGVCVKVETHNHPSAIEPYGGAATGIGGCIRDVIGTGLSAKPIAATDVFCVAFPSVETLPEGCLHPRRVLTEVVAGVRDYGNRIGIPTVSGAVWFDDRHVGNPLVFCGCIGIMPRDCVHGKAHEGDLIVALGGRTGRDGIHGATFSSAELEHTHADEFAHAVQIGNPIEEKRLLDAILRARGPGPAVTPPTSTSPTSGPTVRDGFEPTHDTHPHTDAHPLFHAITDCGAGGFSSAIGEMGAELGAQVDLDRAPLKYDGLSYTEIWISEAQERMILAVPADNLLRLQRICEEEGVELAVLGRFGTPSRELILRYRGTEVGRLDMRFLHEGLPQITREATWQSHPSARSTRSPVRTSTNQPIAFILHSLLSHPNIASKHWIIRQYDHEVQGNLVVKPLIGPMSRGPGDASVIEPVPGTARGLAISQGLATALGDVERGGDPYVMALAAVDECVRNLVCVGTDPDRIAILDNFCWPGCDDARSMAALVRAAAGCYDAAKAYRTPFVSGKDSLNNQFRYVDPATGEPRTIRIPPTLLITGIGIVPNLACCVTADAKRTDSVLLLVGATSTRLGGSHAQTLIDTDDLAHPEPDLASWVRTSRAVAALIRSGLVLAAHDCSDGGLLTAIAEMLISGSTPHSPIGAAVDLSTIPIIGTEPTHPAAFAFAETPGRYLLELAESDLTVARAKLGNVPWSIVARLNDTGRLTWAAHGVNEPVENLAQAWLTPLDW